MRVVLLGLMLSACTSTLIPIPNAERHQPAQVHIHEPTATLVPKVEAYLRASGILQSKAITTATETRFLTTWVRDSSLRYYQRVAGLRIRHLGTWKAQWSVREISPFQSSLSVEVMEVLFAGHPKDAGPGPDMDRKSSWFESSADELRAALLLRRFWNYEYSQWPLPPILANILVPDLNFPIFYSKKETLLYSRPKAF